MEELQTEGWFELLFFRCPRYRGFEQYDRIAYKLMESGEPVTQDLYHAVDSRFMCGEITTATEEKMDFVDLDGDGKRDLRSTILLWQGKGQRLDLGLCSVPFPKEAKTYVLKYLYRAGIFEIAPESVAVKSELVKIMSHDDERLH